MVEVASPLGRPAGVNGDGASSRVDRVFVALPKWMVNRAWIHCYLGGEPREFFKGNVSDRSLVVVVELSRCFSLSRPADQPAPRAPPLFSDPKVKEMFDRRLEAIPFEQLSAHRAVQDLLPHPATRGGRTSGCSSSG